MSERRRRKAQSPRGGDPHVKRAKPSLDLSAAHDDDDEHIHSSSEDEDDRDNREPSLQDESEDEEPLETKRVRLARQYLDKLGGESADSSGSDDDEDDDASDQDHIARKLQRARQKKEGTYERVMIKKVSRHVESLQQGMPANS
jgi:hypothetical protein